ncbi:alpha/beta hydrolase-fold protein [Cyclobacterium sp. 1_MG-2023]|uniref:alpha/beta hydrolase n=1 Tax=Cyclobacterium sp. 1_MG-2023 TaxID=3062681 RepID=UPI0026E2144C|nr:alpha/beta hydrolase-fold protein [Cyclobacterium sp. 1_MG-2023]MDO6437634.1 alpha/beta hydrolase-fold protein [Cyclobacterium sp. 1_MG-2023]
MKILRILLPLFLVSFSGLLAQESRVFDALTMESKILGMERKFAVYLPPGYEYSQRSYPVLYLLHGAGDDQTGWVQFGEVQRIADNAFEDGSATPMIIVMPDANTGKRGYFNDIKNDWRYEDFFFEELMPYVESQYRIKSVKKYRAISGLSMGGGGTYFYAMHRPDLFSSACPLSASLRNTSYDDFLKRYQGEVKDKDQLKAYYEKHQALRQLELNDIEKIKSVKWFFDCGDDDFLYEGNSLVHIAMKKKEIPHEFRIRDGAHNWTYWRASLPNVLSFISETFHQ